MPKRPPMSMEQRAKISAALKGRKLSSSTRRKMSKARMGHRLSKKTRAKISATRIARKVPGHWGEKNPRWKGGRWEAGNGYIYILQPEHPNADHRGYVTEHVLIASAVLGRSLADNEIVHHRNGIRNDNRPENLVVLTRAEHMVEHHIHSLGGKAIAKRRSQKV